MGGSALTARSGISLSGCVLMQTSGSCMFLETSNRCSEPSGNGYDASFPQRHCSCCIVQVQIFPSGGKLVGAEQGTESGQQQ